MLFEFLRVNCNQIFRLFGFVETETNSLFGLFIDVFVHCGTTHHLNTPFYPINLKENDDIHFSICSY